MIDLKYRHIDCYRAMEFLQLVENYEKWMNLMLKVAKDEI